MTNNGSVNPVEILLVEDNEADIRLTKEGFKEAKLANSLQVVHNGIEAMDYLRKKGPWRNASTPDLLLLDLNLPKKDGREVLKEIRSDPDLAAIPVVILTNSKTEASILRSYDLQADCFINKPIDMEKLTKIIRSIERFWFSIVYISSNK